MQISESRVARRKQTMASKYPPTPGTPVRFKGFTSEDRELGKTMTRMRKVEEDSDKTKIEIKGMKEEMSECKRNIERITDWMSNLEKERRI